MNKKLAIAALLLFVLATLLKLVGDYKWQNLANNEIKTKEYNSLVADWGDKKASLQKLNSLIGDFGSKYSSVTINQKRVDSTSFMVAFLVLNSDELDAILKRIINDYIVIKKLEIVNTEIGFLVTFEAQI